MFHSETLGGKRLMSSLKAGKQELLLTYSAVFSIQVFN